LSIAADWYYIGHYGQLGPLTLDQMEELVAGGVIDRDTYVWKQGLPDWMPAGKTPEISAMFMDVKTNVAPPPPPSPGARTAGPTDPYGAVAGMGQQTRPAAPNFGISDPFGAPADLTMSMTSMSPYGSQRSDRSRILAGILQLIIPGVGRIYLGFSAIGVLQLVLSLCGVGFIWSFIDGILILVGNVRMDGYGRQLGD
jgi:hypothetical protein